MEEYLKVCFDRLVRLGVGSIPTTLDLTTIVEWADSTAILEINAATKFIADQKEDMISLEKRRRNQLFQDPKQRGTWIEDTYGIPQSRCPNYAIDEKSGKRI